MMAKIKKAPLILLLLALSFLVYLVLGFVNLIIDTVSQVEAYAPSLADFELYDLALNGEDTLTVTGSDPQIVIENEEMRSVYYRLTGEVSGEVCAYYLKNPEEDFSNHARLFPDFGEFSEAFYVFPHGTNVVRIDLGSENGKTYELEELTINKDIPWYYYFKLTNRELLIFICLPILLYSIIKGSGFLKTHSNNVNP